MEKCSEGLIVCTAGFHIFPIFIMVSGLHIHYLKYFFDMGYFKVFIEFVTILLLFYVLVFWLRGMWGLSSTTKNQPCTLMSWKAKSFNHWITREIPSLSTVSGISMSKTCLVQPANLQSIAWRGDGIGGMGAPPHNSTVDLVSCFEPHPACIGEGNGNPLQCSCLENPRDGGAWWAAVYGIAQSQAWLKWLSSSSCILTFRSTWWSQCRNISRVQQIELAYW